MNKKNKVPKAAIVTWCYNNGRTNYGQILQCYAMQTIVRRLGYDTKVIRYRKRELDEPRVWEGKPLWLIDLYEVWFRLRKVEQGFDIRIKRFLTFIRKNIVLSRQCYTKAEVEEECRDCELLVCGSDQIWNPLWFEDIYALNFGEPWQKKIAYAPSGVLIENTQNERIYRELGRCIDRLKLATVREKKSAEILKKYTNKEIVDVADPTLLLSREEWNLVASKGEIKEPYIFCYSMGRLRTHKVLLRRIMENYHGVKILFLTAGFYEHENELETGGYFYPVKDAGPGEFISLIRGARAVCTDSFHGLALAIIYQKQFYILERDSKEAYLSANFMRQENLLKKVAIKQNRYIRCVKELEALEEIDYENVHLELCREEAEELIKNALKGEAF